MLGSRFDLFQTLDSIASSRASRRAEQIGVDHSAAQLERDMVAVANAVHQRRSRMGIACPVCETTMSIVAEHELPEFGASGVQVREMNCSTCGMLTRRVFHPSVGYDVKIVR